MAETITRTTPLPDEGLPLDAYRKDAELNQHQTRRLALLRRLTAPCGGAALDYGCGYGDMTVRVADKFASVVGVDVNPERVAFASAEHGPAMTFKPCSTDSLEFPDAAFDTVFSVVVLNWVQEHDRYLSEVRRVLAPDGKFVIIASAAHPLNALGRKILGRPTPARRFRPLEPGALIANCKKLGFVVEATDCFYEAPFSRGITPKAAAIELATMPFRLLNVAAMAPYFGVRFSRGTDSC